MAKNKMGGLGRGLDALFADLDMVKETKDETVQVPVEEVSRETTDMVTRSEKLESVEMIKLGDIKPNSKQPRRVFDQKALDDLSNSIKEHGLIQPILVRPAEVGYELVAGERRWRAARLAGLKMIPAIVRDLDDKTNAFYALIENMQREDLNSIEEAEGIKRLMEEFELTHEEAGKAVGKSRSYVSNSLRLLKLPEEVKSLVETNQLTAGHARAIAGLKDEKMQIEAAEKVIAEGWSVRNIEEYTGNQAEKEKATRRRKRKPTEIAAVEQQLSDVLGTKVTLNGTSQKGKLELSYYSQEELEQLIDILNGRK